MRAGIFFAKTDISEFEFGEGSFDKGFYFWLPIEAFSQITQEDMLGLV